MKPPRSPRPAPRTLAATPPPMLRAPRSASHIAGFPSLAALLAGGAALPACQDPQCAETRAEELQSHGQSSMRAAQDGRASEAIREIGVAMGVVTHTQTTSVGSPRPGAIAEVTTVPQPRQPEVPVIPTAGAVAPVSPHPPPPPVVQRTQPTTPQRVNVPRPGLRVPVTPHPPPQEHPRTAGAPPRMTLHPANNVF